VKEEERQVIHEDLNEDQPSIHFETKQPVESQQPAKKGPPPRQLGGVRPPARGPPSKLKLPMPQLKEVKSQDLREDRPENESVVIESLQACDLKEATETLEAMYLKERSNEVKIDQFKFESDEVVERPGEQAETISLQSEPTDPSYPCADLIRPNKVVAPHKHSKRPDPPGRDPKSAPKQIEAFNSIGFDSLVRSDKPSPSPHSPQDLFSTLEQLVQENTDLKHSHHLYQHTSEENSRLRVLLSETEAALNESRLQLETREAEVESLREALETVRAQAASQSRMKEAVDRRVEAVEKNYSASLEDNVKRLEELRSTLRPPKEGQRGVQDPGVQSEQLDQTIMRLNEMLQSEPVAERRLDEGFWARIEKGLAMQPRNETRTGAIRNEI
jgi:hypothetical protein